MKFSKQDWQLGAIYVLGARRGFNRNELVALMVNRTGMSEPKAQQLATHWLSTLPYRKPAVAMKAAA